MGYLCLFTWLAAHASGEPVAPLDGLSDRGQPVTEVRSEDGRVWVGPPVQVEIFGPAPGEAARATLSFSVSAGHDKIGVHVELEPEVFRKTLGVEHGRWSAPVASGGSSRNGSADVSFGSELRPRLASAGRLVLRRRADLLQGEIRGALPFGDARLLGDVVVTCWVAEAAESGAPGAGSVAYRQDASARTPFCRRFRR